MDLFIEVVVECLIQLFGDLILDALFRSRHAAVKLVGTLVVVVFVALALAAVSVAVHPRHFIANPTLRLAALGVMPLLNGLIMSLIGRRLLRHGKVRSAFEYFVPAFVFSLCFGGVRFLFAH